MVSQILFREYMCRKHNVAIPESLDPLLPAVYVLELRLKSEVVAENACDVVVHLENEGSWKFESLFFSDLFDAHDVPCRIWVIKDLPIRKIISVLKLDALV